MTIMSSITIPRTITNGDELVVIPRKEYERFLEVVRERDELENDLKVALTEAVEGKAEGPFYSADELKKSLER